MTMSDTDLRDRIGALAATLKRGEAALVLSDANRQYLSRFSSSCGALLVFKDYAALLVDSRYFEAAREKAFGCEALLMERRDSQLEALLTAHRTKRVLLEDEISVREYARLEKAFAGRELRCDKELSSQLAAMRSQKDASELAAIKKAQSITDRAFEKILEYIEPGVSEKKLHAKLVSLLLKYGADKEAFDTIVLAGKNTSKPHGEPSDYEIKKGDLVLLDFGAKLGGYCSDMTRTVAVKRASDKQKEIYSLVLEAQDAALNAARCGITGAELDKAARGVIRAAGYGKNFGHGLGHSLGLEIHESPSASPANKRALPADCIMTVEPGVYLEGEFGVRIEDMVILLANGAENLTKSPKKLIIV